MDNRNTNNNSDFWSWAVIIGLFVIGAWPISAILLYLKLFKPKKQDYRYRAPSLSREEAARQSAERAKQMEKERTAEEVKKNIKSFLDSPKEKKSTSSIMFGVGICFLILAFVALFVIADEITLGGVLFTLSAACSGVGLLVGSRKMKNTLKRYERYLALIGKNDAYQIDSLVNKTGYSKHRVEKDLDNMIDDGYFGKTAYLNRELGYFFTSSAADEELAKAKAAAIKKTADIAKNEAAKQTETVYDQLLHQIRDVNDRIPGEEMTEKISRLEEITRNIFDEVKKNPDKRKRIDRFMSYYLPTALKLLEHYAELDKKNVEGENISKAKESIENAMDSIVDGFTAQLDELYKDENLDIETDIDVMLKMMEKDNAKATSDFKTKNTHGTSSVSLGGSAAQTK